MSVFKAVVRIDATVEKVYSKGRTVTVDYAARMKKLDNLERLLRKQKMVYTITPGEVDGKPVAILRSVSHAKG